MRQAHAQLFVHPAAVRDVCVNDGVVFHGETVVILIVSVQNQHNRLARVMHAERRQIEEIAGNNHARSAGNRLSHTPHDGVKILERQRVLDGRLAVAAQRLREANVVVAISVVRQHGVIREVIGLPVREQVGDDVHHAAHLVGQHVHDARLLTHALHARTVIDQTRGSPGNGASAPASGGRQ